MLRQRIFGIALGYEDINDHDQLRHDPVLGVLANSLTRKRSDCAPLAGKSTLNRLEHAAKVGADPYHKITHDPAAIERLFNAMLFNTSGVDIVSYLIVVPAIILATLLAAYVPARRALRIAPTQALRCE